MFKNPFTLYLTYVNMSDHRNRPNTLLVKLNKMFLKKDTIPFLSTRFCCDQNLSFFQKKDPAAELICFSISIKTFLLLFRTKILFERSTLFPLYPKYLYMCIKFLRNQPYDNFVKKWKHFPSLPALYHSTTPPMYLYIV